MTTVLILTAAVLYIIYCMRNQIKYGNIEEYGRIKEENYELNKMLSNKINENEILGGIIGNLEIDDFENWRHLKKFEKYSKNNEEIKYLKEKIKKCEIYIINARVWGKFIWNE